MADPHAPQLYGQLWAIAHCAWQVDTRKPLRLLVGPVGLEPTTR